FVAPDGGQDRGERGARLGGVRADLVLPFGLGHDGGEPRGDGLALSGLPPGRHEIGRQAGQAEEQQCGEHQCHVHTHQVPVESDVDSGPTSAMQLSPGVRPPYPRSLFDENPTTSNRGEGLASILPAYRSLNSHPGPTTDAFSSSQRRLSSRSAVTTRQLSSSATASATAPTMASSPEPGAETIRTGGFPSAVGSSSAMGGTQSSGGAMPSASEVSLSSSATAPLACPSRTSTQAPAVSSPRWASAITSRHSRSAAPARSCHQPSARAPMTLATSTTTTDAVVEMGSPPSCSADFSALLPHVS